MKHFITTIILAIIGAVSGPFLALAGASLAGLPQSDWSLEPLVYLALGFLAGGPGFLLLLAILTAAACKPFPNRALLAVSLALSLAFLSGLIGVPISKRNSAANQERSRIKSAASDRRYQEFYSILRSDPETAVRENWYRATDERRHAYRMSVQNLDVSYAPATLARLYAVDGDMTALLLKHPSFDQSLLESEFRRVMKRFVRGGDCDRLAGILRNPNARDEWFAEIISSGILEKDISPCAGSLKSLIEKRERDRRNDPPRSDRLQR